MLNVAAVCGAALGSVGCQAAGGSSPYFYGSGDACTEKPPQLSPLEGSLAPLRLAFDAFSSVPRVVVLMPHMGCERGAEILRREVLDAHPDARLRLFVIWQDTARVGGESAAARASAYLADPRVTAFYDCSGIAGRAFARGNLPVAEAREVFLFYPAGLTWPSDGSRPSSARPVADATPQTETWVHQIGRVAPERFCTPEELPRAIRATVDRLLEDARAREERLEGERDAAQRVAARAPDTVSLGRGPSATASHLPGSIPGPVAASSTAPGRSD